MVSVVKLFFFSPSDYALLQQAVVAADLPRREALAPYVDYVRDVERDARGLEGDGVVVQRRVINVEAMLRWLSVEGLLPDRRGRERYVRAVHGPSPLRRRYRGGMLLAWADGGDTHWDGEPEASNTNDWYARLDAQLRAAVARKAAEADGGRYNPWGDWKSRWRPGC